jgi:DNA-binding NtrC family response regulator
MTDKIVRLPLVVCVDDDADMLAAVVRTLRSMDVEILHTSNPITALDYIGTRDVAVLISDFEMPEMTGVELAAAAIRVSPGTVRVLMTGRQSLDTAVEGINQGEIYRYVQKPFQPKVMRKAIEEALARHHELAATLADREKAHLRDELARALELEFPGIADVERDTDGAYRIAERDAAAVAGMGLDPIAFLAHA